MTGFFINYFNFSVNANVMKDYSRTRKRAFHVRSCRIFTFSLAPGIQACETHYLQN